VTTTEPGSTRPRTPPPPPQGVKSQPAKRGQFCTGADKKIHWSILAVEVVVGQTPG
jgi:hypothetical protein